jgi:hypothetical protein
MNPPGGRCILLVACLAALACSSSSGSSGVTIEQACAAVAQARCDLRSTCSLPEGAPGTGFTVLESYGDMATCVARETLACQNALSAPETGNSPAAVQKCVLAFAGYTCQELVDNLPPASCAPTGPRATGSACTFNGQCATGFCNGTKDSACGTCGPPPTVGGDCSTSACARGFRCLGSTSTCAAVVIADGVCDDTHPCERGLSCVRDGDTAATGTCEAAGTRVGVACGGTMPGCDPTRGLTCAGPGGARTCTRIGYGGTTAGPDGGVTASDAGAAGPTPAGAPCGRLPDGTRVGCVAGTCFTATGVATGSELGTCQPLAADGEACDTALGPGCMAPARCVTTGETAGTCVIPTAAMCPGA